MPDEQEIESVPEGFRVAKIYPYAAYAKDAPPEDTVFRAVIERIQKPKQRVQVAEFDLQDGETVANIRGIRLLNLNSPHFIDKGQREADRTRIEERDA